MKGKLLSLLILSLLLVFSYQEEAEVHQDSEVLVLGDNNLTSTLQENDFAFLQFYAPWCGHCKHLAPEYERLPALVKHLNVIVGKIDATQQKQTAQKYEIQGFPTLKFYSKGRLIDYKGERTAEEIANWIQNVIMAKIETISQETAAQKAKGDQVIIIRSNKGQNIETMRLASVSDQTTQYYAVKSDVETVTLYLKDQSPIKYDGQISVSALQSWITTQTLPTLIELSNQNAINYVFTENSNDIIVIIQHSSVFDGAAKSDTQKFCQENEGKFICTICKPSDSIYEGVKGYFKFQDQEKNLLTYIKSGYSEAFIATFTPQQATYQTLKQWKQSIDAGKQQNIVKAQPQESQIKYESVVKLTNENFDSYISENPITFIQFYATFCGHCKSFAPIYEKFAKQMIEAGSQYKIAAINCQQQQQICSKHSISGYPTLKLFYHGVSIDYQGGRNGQAIKAFIDKIRDSKPITVENLSEVKRPAAVIFDSAEVTSLTKVSALYSRYPVYHIREGQTIKIKYLGQDESEDAQYTGEIGDKLVAAWLKDISAPAIVDFGSEQLDPQVSDALSEGSPLIIFFINQLTPENNHENAIAQLKKYCKNTKGQVLCGFTQKGKGLYSNILDWLNLKSKEDDLNYLVWINTTTIDYFIYDKKANEVTSESIEDYVKRIKNHQFDKQETADEQDSEDENAENQDAQDTEDDDESEEKQNERDQDDDDQEQQREQEL